MKINLPFSFLFFLLTFSINAQVPDSVLQSLQGSLSNPVNSVNPNSDLDISPARTIITAVEIEERGYDNLDELLASVQGISLSHDRTFTQIGIRGISPTGTNNQRVQILLDNVPLNNLLTGQAPSGFDLRGIGMEDIAEVEIIRNSSAVKNGNNSMLGVIKIKTKKARKGGRINIDTGSFGEIDGGFALGHTFGKTTVGFLGRLGNLPGQELFIPGDVILEKEKSEFGGFQFQLSSGKFSAHVTYNQRNELIAAVPNNPFEIQPDSSFAILGNIYTKEELDQAGNFNSDQLFVDLNFSTPFRNRQSMDIRLFANYDQSERLQVFRDTEFFLDTIGNLDTVGYLEYNEVPQVKNLWTGLEYQHHFHFQPKHHLTLGTSILVSPISNYKSENTLFTHFDGADTITQDFWDDILNYMDAKGEEYKKNFSYWSVGFFAQDKFQINRYLTINAGLRVDINSQTKPVFAPELSFQLSPFEKTKIRLGYGRGYRLPSLVETNVVVSDPTIPTMMSSNSAVEQDFVPETSNNFELGLNQKVGKDLDLNIGLYHQQLNDLIWNETNAANTQTDSTWKATGLEAGLGVNLIKGVKTFINYNFQFDRKNKINMPSPLCKFGVSIPFLNHFSIFTEGQYEGSRLTFNGKNTRAYFLMNTNFLIRPRLDESQPAAKWLNQLSFAFRVYNMFDQFYEHPSGQNFTAPLIPQNGRTWQTQLTFKF
ncbi:MAG: TonB-dependent receptor plug domain-containing protein [Saprospiraceae bacterium]